MNHIGYRKAEKVNLVRIINECSVYTHNYVCAFTVGNLSGALMEDFRPFTSTWILGYTLLSLLTMPHSPASFLNDVLGHDLKSPCFYPQTFAYDLQFSIGDEKMKAQYIFNRFRVINMHLNANC